MEKPPHISSSGWRFSLRALLVVTTLAAIGMAAFVVLVDESERGEVLAILGTFFIATVAPLVFLQLAIRRFPRAAGRAMLALGLGLIPVAAYWGPKYEDRSVTFAAALASVFCLGTAALIYWESRRD
jgi:hypothetical protein